MIFPKLFCADFAAQETFVISIVLDIFSRKCEHFRIEVYPKNKFYLKLKSFVTFIDVFIT